MLRVPKLPVHLPIQLTLNLNTLDQGIGGYGGNTASLMEFMTGKADGNAQTEAFKFYNLEL